MKEEERSGAHDMHRSIDRPRRVQTGPGSCDEVGSPLPWVRLAGVAATLSGLARPARDAACAAWWPAWLPTLVARFVGDSELAELALLWRFGEHGNRSSFTFSEHSIYLHSSLPISYTSNTL